MPPRRAAVPPSPARSTRSARSNRDEDDWESESVTSSFKVPTSRGKGNNNTSASSYLVDTSVNIAAAFNAAKTGHLMPSASIDQNHSFSSKSMSSRKPPSQSRSSVSRAGSQRAQSPAEQLASAARALSPVRFFLKSTQDDDGDIDVSGAYTSFSSLGHSFGNGVNGANHSGESYDYQQEEEFVRQAQKSKTKGPRTSDPKKRRGKAALSEDLPYRPVEDDDRYDSDDSGGQGEGIVRGGGLVGRAATRGKRQEQGEGYLGQGLGFQPRQRRKNRKSGEGDSYAEVDGSEEEEHEDFDMRSQRAFTPITPQIEVSYSHGRSPTPARLLRALSPRLDRRSPAPTFHPRKRKPSSLRTIITNLLHGLVIGLRFAVESITNLLHNILLRPGQSLFGTGKDLLRRLKSDWWKWIGGLIALSIAMRVVTTPWQSKGVYHVPEAPPGNIDEVAARITSLEQFTADLSEMLKTLNKGEAEHKVSADAILGRMNHLENSVMLDQKRVEALKGEGDKGFNSLQHSIDTLRAEVGTLNSRVGKSEKSVSKAESKLGSIEDIDRDVQSLKTRVGEVERQVKDALDDGRLRAALERLLPDFIPIRVNSRGVVEVDPKFWSEMKKVMMERTETEALIKKALSQQSNSASNHQQGKGKKAEEVQVDERKVRAWAHEVFERKSVEENWMSKDMFQDLLHGELEDLRSDLAAIKSRAQAQAQAQKSTTPSSASPPRSSVIIRSANGDDLTTLFNDLIDTALLRYSKDTIARTDFALFTAGARVIPQLTSDTLVLSTASKVGKWVMGSKDVIGRPPATALHPDTSVGSCWPFEGSEGSLGVMLTRRVRVSDITIEHAPRELALDTSTAPRSIQVMGVIDNDEDKAKLAAYWAERGESEPIPDHLPLATVTYDPQSISHIQTFPVPSDIQALDIKVGVVVFKVESNWGGGLTCLYRVRLHGDADE